MKSEHPTAPPVEAPDGELETSTDDDPQITPSTAWWVLGAVALLVGVAVGVVMSLGSLR